MTLLHMTTQQQERVDAMVLIGTAHFFSDPMRDKLREVDPQNIPAEEMQRLRERHKRGDLQIIDLMKQFSSFKDIYDDMNFTPSSLAKIATPTLVIHGDRDEFIPVSSAVELYESIPCSYFWMVPNGTHKPIFGPNQEYFVELVTTFLKGRMPEPDY